MMGIKVPFNLQEALSQQIKSLAVEFLSAFNQ